MKITEISVSYDRKKSDGNYGSEGFFHSITASVEPDESIEEATEALYAECKKLVLKQINTGATGPYGEPNTAVMPASSPRKWNPADQFKRDRALEYAEDGDGQYQKGESPDFEKK